MRAALLLLVVGCTIPERDQTGPTIHIDLNSNIEDVGDTTSMPQFSLDGDSQYVVKVTLSTQDGTETKQDSESTFMVSTYAATFSVPNVTIPDSGFTSDGYDDPTYTRDMAISIPASAKGQALKIHVEASDSRGLAANILDFSVALK